MIGSRLVWSMAWGNIKRQWRQTLLTAAAGTIGAMLIAISVINYTSVRSSGDEWIQDHFGPIDWALTQVDSRKFSLSQLEVQKIIAPYMEHKVPIRFLPIMNTDSGILFTLDEQGKIAHSQNGLQVIGLDPDEAVKFDLDNSLLWSSGLHRK